MRIGGLLAALLFGVIVGAIGDAFFWARIELLPTAYRTINVNGTCAIEQTWLDAHLVVHHNVAVVPNSSCREVGPSK